MRPIRSARFAFDRSPDRPVKPVHLSLSFSLFVDLSISIPPAAQTTRENRHRSEFIRSLPFARNKSPTFRERRTVLNLPARVPRFVALFVHVFERVYIGVRIYRFTGFIAGSCHGD